MVWKLASKETGQYFRSDKRAWVGSIATAIVSGFIASQVVDRWSNSMTPWIVQLVGITSGTVIGWCVFVFGLYGWNGFWHVPARLYNDRNIRANKFTWNDIDISLIPYPRDSIFGYGIRIKNNKPFNISKVFIQVIWHKLGNNEVPLSTPHKLPRIEERGYIWEGTTLVSGREETWCLYRTFYHNNRNGDYVEFAVPQDGQPINNTGGIGSFIEQEDVSLLEIEFVCEVDDMPLSPKTIRKIYRAWGENGKPHVHEYQDQE